MSASARRVRRGALLATLVIAHGGLGAVQTRTWTESTGQIQGGSADGIALTRQGRLVLAPRLTRLGEDGPSPGAAHVWAVATDAHGNAYLGTGPEGRILRVAASGTESVFATLAAPMVTSLLVLRDGSLLAGTAPEGKIYRVHPDGGSELWCSTDERYVWSLVQGPGASVYAGTGDRGIVLEIGSSGKAETLFDSDESHIMSLAVLPSGELVAGGAGRGLVYRLNPKGGGEVLYDTDMPEVSQIVVERDGSLVATALSSPDPEPRPPAVRIRVPQNASVGSTSESALELDERGAATLEGVIEGLSSEGTESRGGRRARGRVVRISPSGSTSELWRSVSEAPLALALDAQGRPVFGTGEPGRIYRVAENADVDLLATVREGQVTRLLAAGDHLLAGTSNPAALYRMEKSLSTNGVFVSRPFDAQAQAHWGVVRWREEGAAGGVEIQARSGNSAEPDGTWSDWGQAVSDPLGGRTGVPDGRFLQWRARLAGSAAASTRVGEVSVSFVTVNRPPVLDSFRQDGGEPVSNRALKFRWNASDPDADAVAVTIEYRALGSTEWKTAVRSEPGTDSEGSEGADSYKEGKGTWETSELAEGRYEVRARASDQQGNAPREGREATWEPPLWVVIDRTPPEIELRRQGDGTLEAAVTDALSTLRRVEVVEDERVLYLLPPLDGVADSVRETFRIPSDAAAAHRELRAVDAAGNVATQELGSR